MQCNTHPGKKVGFKCTTCCKFVCSECSRQHKAQKHELLSLIQLSELLRAKVARQISKIGSKLVELSTVNDCQTGQTIIQNCKVQLLEFINNIFQELKAQFRRIADLSWKNQNLQLIAGLEQRKSTLEQWLYTINKRPDQSALFELQQIYENNRVSSDEQPQHQDLSHPKRMMPTIVFNQIALRRSYEALAKVIHTEVLANRPRRKASKSSSRKKLEPTEYHSLAKFVQGNSTLYEYILDDPESPTPTPTLLRTQFRQFVAPARSVTLTLGPSIYLIGGLSPQHKPRKQILLLDRTFTTVRVLGLMRYPRVGHAGCAYGDQLFMFGGRGSPSLQTYHIRGNKSQILLQREGEIMGSSMCVHNGRLYIFGGSDGVSANKQILVYDLANRHYSQLSPINSQAYTMPISPLLQPISSSQILILGGYYSHGGRSYHNTYILAYNTDTNYYRVQGKGQQIYPLVSNGNNCTMKDNKLICMAELRRVTHQHGPNLPVVFSYDLEEDVGQLDLLGAG